MRARNALFKNEELKSWHVDCITVAQKQIDIALFGLRVGCKLLVDKPVNKGADKKLQEFVACFVRQNCVQIAPDVRALVKLSTILYELQTQKQTCSFIDFPGTCQRDIFLENVSTLPPSFALSCEIGLIGTNCLLITESFVLLVVRGTCAACCIPLTTRKTKDFKTAELLIPRNTNTVLK